MFKPMLTPQRATAAIQAAATIFEVSPRAITGARGTPRVALARHAAIAALYSRYETSYSELGRLFGRDHTTVMYAVARAGILSQDDEEFAAALGLIGEARGE